MEKFNPNTGLRPADSLVNSYIDLDAISKNVAALKKLIPSKTMFMAVVKADGYGHGAVPVAQKAIATGADWLGVARLEEAVPLRENSIKAPLLIFGYVDPSKIRLVRELDLTLTVYNFEMAKNLSEKAEEIGADVPVHLKVDTGMGRVGMIVSKDPDVGDARKVELKEIEKISKLPGITLEGIYTHFAAADEKDRTYTENQIDFFKSLLNAVKEAGVDIPMCHAANSAGIIEYPEAHLDMVRAGISLYGLYPSLDVDQSKAILSPAMTLKTLVTGVRKVPEGFFVSYGMTHRTDRETTLASVPIGYADGFSRAFSSNGTMLVKGSRAPVVGRVCMDQTMIDVGHIKKVAPGDEVVLIGKQGNEYLSADELARKTGTINYEIVSALTSRVRRIYLEAV